jgi:hypothetical protein
MALERQPPSTFGDPTKLRSYRPPREQVLKYHVTERGKWEPAYPDYATAY